MLQNNPLVGFIPSKHPDEARDFYEGVLGFALTSDNGYVATYKAGNTILMLQKMNDDFVPAARTIAGWEVKSIRDVVSDLTKRGVKFLRESSLQQDDLGIWQSPDGKVAWFKDPDGNTLSVAEH